MIVTEKFLKEKGACIEGMEWFEQQQETSVTGVVNALIADNQLHWANWLILQLVSYNQSVAYAVFAVEQVIDIYARRYPADQRPQNAISTARKCLIDPSRKNKNAARAAAYAAADAADDKTKLKILNYGLDLLREEKEKC